MSSIDLNLLAVFDALYETRSVTRAAQRLNLTQSAVSHALRRLRDTVGDPLFLRSSQGLQPTVRAQSMAPGISEGVGRLRAAVAPIEFDPAVVVRTFTVAAGSYFCALLIPELVTYARRVAPGVTFRVVPVGSTLLAELDEGIVELALGAFDRVPERLSVQTLFREDLVWIAAQANPIRQARPTADELLGNPHLVVATRRAFEPVGTLLAEGPLESLLTRQRLHRDGHADIGSASGVVYDAMTAAAVVARTDLVALVPRRLANSEKDRLGLRIIEAEEEGQSIDLGMISHQRTAADPGIAWLRSALERLSR